MRRPRLRSLRNKLALLFLGITATALTVMYVAVVPQLESNLRAHKLADLERVAKGAESALEGLMGRQDISAKELDRRVRSIADSAGARITLLGVQQSRQSRSEEPFYVITDTREEREVPQNPGLARRAADTEALARGQGVLGGEALGQVAQPLSFRGENYWIALYSQSLEDVSDTVSLIRNRLLLATAAALLLALIGGYGVAQALARRVRRLEDGAHQVAAGNFIEPLPVDSEDELGQLTRTFNEMQQQLRRVDVARKDFVATASHELRTPIFSLGGFVELLRDEELDEATRREFIDTMAEQVERLQKLAVDLLDLSRLDAGSVQLEREPVDLSEVARAVTSEFLPVLTPPRPAVELRLPEPGVQARCDRGRVAQIIRILIDNALTHTPEGTQVTVTSSRSNGTARLTVADDGPGLPAETQVFERFTTGDNTRGAGLGLAIAVELAERMDGDIRTEARSVGTAFTLRLPADDWASGT
ncbi:MAG TPA: HAMP domain-containing sensor histidine kinase [Thermoleophilaceae bacterium]|nr:HAMP domain-containing sensor histidine kinase [Thermoleophilaceae bacterium]